MIQSAAVYYYLLPCQEIVTIISLYLEQFATGQEQSTHLYCNISRVAISKMHSGQQGKWRFKYIATGLTYPFRSGLELTTLMGYSSDLEPCAFQLDHTRSLSA